MNNINDFKSRCCQDSVYLGKVWYNYDEWDYTLESFCSKCEQNCYCEEKRSKDELMSLAQRLESYKEGR